MHLLHKLTINSLRVTNPPKAFGMNSGRSEESKSEKGREQRHDESTSCFLFFLFLGSTQSLHMRFMALLLGISLPAFFDDIFSCHSPRYTRHINPVLLDFGGLVHRCFSNVPFIVHRARRSLGGHPAFRHRQTAPRIASIQKHTASINSKPRQHQS